MFTLVQDELPAVGLPGVPGAPSFVISGDEPPAAFVANPGAVLPGVAGVGEIVTVGTTAPSPVSGATVITNASEAIVIQTPERIYTPAADPGDPQDGEFVRNPYTGEAILYPPVTTGLAVVAVLPDAATVLYRTRVPGPHPDWFQRFPVTGQISLTLEMEQYPTGSVQMEVTGRAGLLTLLDVFRNDTLVSVYGYALRVTNVSFSQNLISQNPEGRFSLTISLAGAQEREFGEPVTVQEILNRVRTGDEPVAAATVQQIALINGVSVQAPSMEVPLASRAATDTVTAEDEFRARLRHLGCFAELVSGTVVARNIDEVGNWQYSDADVLEPPTVQYLGRQEQRLLSSTARVSQNLLPGALPTTFLSSVGDFTLQAEDTTLIGRANEFPVTEITGTFSGDIPPEATAEDKAGKTLAQAKPRWKKTGGRLVTVAKGDLDAETPPAETTKIQTVSLLYTNSGPTKTIEWETSENGSPVSAETKTYGFIFAARDYISGDKLIINNPRSVWQLCRHTTTTFEYDKETGYFLGTTTTGRERFAFQNETDELETATLEAGAERDSFAIKWRRVFEATGRTLQSLASVYGDVDPNEGKWVYFTYTGPDGQEQVSRRRDPGFAVPMFMSQESTFRNTFESTASWEEDFTDASGNPIKPPPVTTGEESFSSQEIQIKPAPRQRIGSGSGARVDGQDTDRYTVFQKEQSASGPRFQDFVSRTTFQENLGRPGIADRKASSYEQVEPEDDQVAPRAEESNVQYIVTSPGYNPTDPARDSQSYPWATTREEAQTAVRTDAIVADITNPSRTVSITVPANLQAKPGDRLQVTLAGIIYRCRINRLSHQVSILGVVDGVLEVEGRTQMELGVDREPQFTWTERPEPGTVDENGQPGQLNRVQNLILNKVPPALVTRRNF